MTANKEVFQEKYLEFQYLVQQYQEMQKHLEQLQKHFSDLQGLSGHLKVISSSEENSETLLPLGSGMYIKGKLGDKQEVLVNVGSNVVVTKNLEGASSSVIEQSKEVSQVLSQLEGQISELTGQLQKAQKELQALQQVEKK